MPLVTAYTTSFPGSSLAAWDGAGTPIWSRRGTINSETWNTGSGFEATMDNAEGYEATLASISVDTSKEFEVELVVGANTSINGSMPGVMIADSSGNGIMVGFYGGSPTGVLILSVTNWTYTGSGNFNTVTGSTTRPSRLRIRKPAGSTTYEGYWSTDGVTWTGPATYTGPASPAKFSFGNIAGSSIATIQATELTVRAFGYNTITTAPTGLVVNSGNTQLNTSWTAHADAQTYDVRVDGGTPITGITSPSRVITGLTNGTLYSVEVRAVNPNGPGPWSSPVTGTPTVTDVLIEDSFDRANNASALGSPSITGGPYTVRVGTWGIIDNRAYTSVSTSGSVATFPAAIDVSLEATLPIATTTSQGFVVRWVDNSNHWAIGSRLGVYGIQRFTAGAETIYATTATQAAGDVVKAVAQGRMLHLIVNGKVRLSVEDHFFATATTTCGLRLSLSTAARMDNLIGRSTVTLPVDGSVAKTLSKPQTIHDVDLSPLFVYKGRDTRAEDALTGVP